MKKLVMVSAVASSLCMYSLMGHAQQSQHESSNIQAVNASTNTTAIKSSKSSPIFYGTESKFPFSQAVRAGNTLYMSGQIGIKEGKLVTGGVKEETKQALDNINQTLLNYGYQSKDLVKCMVMLTDMDDFAEFNETYQAKLSKPYPVRSAFGVDELALGAKVEIECMAVK